MGQGEDSSGQGDPLQVDPAWPWQPPAQVTVERSPERAGLIAVPSGVTAAILIWLTILYAWRGDSWSIWLPYGCAAVLSLVNAGRWTTRWRRQRERQGELRRLER